jgi:hypothetical protein
MSCKESTLQKYKTRPSPPFPANSCPDMNKIGNDGKMYKSIANRNNVYSWKLLPNATISNPSKSILENTYDLTNCKKFEIVRSNSLLKVSQYKIVTLNTKGMLHIVLNKDFNPIEDYINLHQVNFEYSMAKGYIEIAFDDIDLARYRIRITNHKQELKIDAILKTIPSRYLLTSDDSLPITIGHHFGDLILFTPKLLQYLHKSVKYYIVVGQQWDTDYTGERSIGVLQYEGVVKNDFGSLDVLGIMWNLCGDKEKEEVKKTDNFSPISSNSGLFGTGSGHDPVHFILRFAKKFKPPKFLPRAECVSIA